MHVPLLAVEKLPQSLRELVPVPDEAFVRHALSRTGLTDVDRSGVRDREELFVVVHTVLVMLAAAVDVLHAAVAAEST